MTDQSFQGVWVFSEAEVVGRVSEFTHEEDFLTAVQEEYTGMYAEVTPEMVTKRFVRFYINPPESCSGNEFPDGCYSFCDKAGRGAFECFVFDGRRPTNHD